MPITLLRLAASFFLFITVYCREENANNANDIQKKYRYNTKSKMSLNYEKIKAMVLKDTRYRISPGLDFEGCGTSVMKEVMASKVEGRGLARSDAIDHGLSLIHISEPTRPY